MPRRRAAYSGSRPHPFAGASIERNERSTSTVEAKMSDLRTLLDRAMGPFDPSPERALDLTVRRAAQRQRRRRVGAAVVGLTASLVALGFAIWAFAGRDATQPAGAER